MKNWTGLFLLLALVFGSQSCRKDSIDQNTTVTPPEPLVYVQTEIEGRVIDTNGDPVEGAIVNMAGSQVVTDLAGFFKISAAAPQNLAVLSVQKQGYFTNFPSVNPTGEGTISVTVKLIEKIALANFSAGQGGTAELSNGAGAEFAPGAFLDEQGNVYSGEVVVFGQYIDPTADDLNEIMPGNLTAIDAEGNDRGLMSMGMLRIELESPSGEQLQISSPSTITVPVPSDLQGQAPETIPLWYFDEVLGKWIEEGSASLQGTEYVGEVNHFTFWNCDVPVNFIYLEGQVELGGVPQSLQVCVTWLETGVTTCTQADDKGYFEGWVPIDAELLLEVIDDCGQVLYSETVGPYTSDTDLGVIDSPVPADYWVTVSGTVTNCDGQPVTNGYVLLATSNAIQNTSAPINNGSFTAQITACSSNEITAYAVDLDALYSSDPVSVTLSYPTDLGQITACDNQFVPGATMWINGNEIFLGEVEISADDISSSLIEVQITDDQGNDNKVIYTFTFIDWNGNPDNPFWAFAYTTTSFGDPVIYNFSSNNTTFLQFGTEVGDIVEIEILPVHITASDGQDDLLGKLRINGIIE